MISFTRKGKLIQPVDIFTKGKDFDSVDYPSQTHPDAVVWAARTAVIHRPYNVISFNCDYFTRYCHGLTLESPQATRLTVAGILVAAGLAIAAASQT